MRTHTAQAHIEAPVESVWELLGDPRRHPEWWPHIVEVRGERFSAGDEYVLVAREFGRNIQAEWLVEGRDELREIRFRCLATGTVAHWQLAEARGGTFVQLELGLDPLNTRMRMFDASVGRLYFARWAQASVDALRRITCDGALTRA